MEKNTIWAIVLSALVLVVFMFIQMVYFPEQIMTPTAVENPNQVVSTTEVQLEDTSATLSATENNSSNEISVENDETLSEETYVITTEKVRVTHLVK